MQEALGFRGAGYMNVTGAHNLLSGSPPPLTFPAQSASRSWCSWCFTSVTAWVSVVMVEMETMYVDATLAVPTSDLEIVCSAGPLVSVFGYSLYFLVTGRACFAAIRIHV